MRQRAEESKYLKDLSDEFEVPIESIASFNPNSDPWTAEQETEVAPAEVITEDGEVVPAQIEAQAESLNGAQVTALTSMAAAVADGSLSRESAKALASAAFPQLTQEQIDSIFDPIEVAPPPSETATD